MVAGCAGTGPAGRDTVGVAHDRVSKRPRLTESAAEVYSANGAGQLDFFDALESRELVSQDDALHAVLLAWSGTSAPTFVQRAALAKRSGIVGAGWNPQPRDAITSEELAMMLDGVALAQHAGGAVAGAKGVVLTSPDSLQRMRERGIIPRGWRANRGVSGPELLAILSRARLRVTDEAGGRHADVDPGDGHD